MSSVKQEVEFGSVEIRPMHELDVPVIVASGRDRDQDADQLAQVLADEPPHTRCGQAAAHLARRQNRDRPTFLFLNNNATTGLNTGAGSGTQRVDSSGNLVNIGTLTLSGLGQIQMQSPADVTLRVGTTLTLDDDVAR